MRGYTLDVGDETGPLNARRDKKLRSVKVIA